MRGRCVRQVRTVAKVRRHIGGKEGLVPGGAAPSLTFPCFAQVSCDISARSPLGDPPVTVHCPWGSNNRHPSIAFA